MSKPKPSLADGPVVSITVSAGGPYDCGLVLAETVIPRLLWDGIVAEARFYGEEVEKSLFGWMYAIPGLKFEDNNAKVCSDKFKNEFFAYWAKAQERYEAEKDAAHVS